MHDDNPISTPGGDSLAAERSDEEDARLVTGAADILAAICVAIGLATFAAMVGAFGFLAGVIVAAAAFGLAIPLVRRRNFAACAIVLALACALGTAAALAFLGAFVGLAVAAVMAWFWKTYRVPIAGALVVAAPIASLVVGAFSRNWFSPDSVAAVPSLAAGAILFVCAMAVDMRDTRRETRRSGIAFWLHIFAAPCIVHGIFSLVGVVPRAGADIAAIPVLVIVAAMAIVALIIDRRPLLASSIGYVVYAVASLGRDMPIANKLIMVSLTVGLGILAMAAFWTPMRRGLLALAPSGLRDRVPAAGAFIPADPIAEDDGEGEPVRLVSGFNDIFVVMGTLPVYFGAWILGGLLVWKEGLVSRGELAEGWLPPAMLALVVPAAACWVLAEFFVRVRRMALPAIALAGQFALVAFAGGVAIGFWIMEAKEPGLNALRGGISLPALLAACALGAVANLAFGWRHRVPISLAYAALCLLPLFFADLLGGLDASQRVPAATELAARLRLLAAGALALVAAVALDRSDQARVSQRSDAAFWMHVLASLLIVPNLFGLIGDIYPAVAIGFVIMAALLLFALVTDRRAPLIVGLPFFAFGVASRAGESMPISVAIIALAAALLWSVVRWQQMRDWALARLPQRTTAG